MLPYLGCKADFHSKPGCWTAVFSTPHPGIYARTWSEALFCHEADKDINLTNAAKADLARLTSTRSTLLPTHMAHISGGRNKDVEKIATIAPIDHGSGEPGSGSHGFNARRSFSTWRGDREASQSDIVPNYQGCKETQLPTFCRINTK